MGQDQGASFIAPTADFAATENSIMRTRDYQAKIIDNHAKLDAEAICLELFISFLAGVFAYIGYLSTKFDEQCSNTEGN